ncbi:MAG: OmpA family protein [Gammaproteobacteria bacterium]|nr:OmpA family protein [Gammaproteobacteria bacterium]
MKNTTRFIAVGFILFAVNALAWNVDKPDDPAAHDAAKISLTALGPDRGARTLSEDIRTIEGLNLSTGGQGLALVASVEQLQQAIKDLDAEVKDMEITVALSSDVLFDFDKANIKAAAQTELEKLGLIIREKRTGDVTITGHTDAKGGDDYNLKLSDRRAASVKDWLVKNAQIDAAVIKTQGLGETKPVAPNTQADGSDDPEGRAKNRRVEIVIQTKEKLK